MVKKLPWMALCFGVWHLRMIQHVHELFMHLCAKFGRGTTPNALTLFLFKCVFCVRLTFKHVQNRFGKRYRNRHVQIKMEVRLYHRRLIQSVCNACKIEDGWKHHFPLGQCMEPFFSLRWFSQTFGGDSEKAWAKLLQDTQHRVAWPCTVSCFFLEIYTNCRVVMSRFMFPNHTCMFWFRTKKLNGAISAIMRFLFTPTCVGGCTLSDMAWHYRQARL